MLQTQHELFINKEKGFTHVGGGCFATVWGHESSPDMVIKQAVNIDGALPWLLYCRTQQGRKGVPVIESLVLVPTTYREYWCEAHLGSLFDGYRVSQRVGYICTMRRYEGLQDGVDDYPTQFSNYDSKVAGGWEYMAELERDYCDLTDRDWNDLHSGNMLKDKDGTLIVTDPDSRNFGIEDLPALMEKLTAVVPAFDLVMQ
jgi:hypothetical protein